VSRDELSAQALAELEALDAILARQPVSEEHLELAALVDSVRGGAPKPRPEFEAALAARFQDRRANARRRPALRPSGRWAFAGGAVVAFAVALSIVLSGNVRDSLFGGGSAPTRAGVLEHPRSVPLEREPTIAPRSLNAQSHKSASAGGAGAVASPPTPAAAAPNTAFGVNAGRLVAKGSTLTLATPPTQISALASHIVSATEAQNGVVEHSNVNVNGGASSYASFTLSVPSGRLGHLIAALSSLASVRALNQSTHDITGSYESENSLLARRQAQLRSLRAQLLLAPTATAAAALRKQISGVEHRITVERATLGHLRSRADNATLSVQVVAGAAKKHHAGAVGALTRGYHDALHALQEILAIALIVLAIVLPFALCGLALWWAAWGVRQRARERAIRAA
jgi:hypothetical protein